MGCSNNCVEQLCRLLAFIANAFSQSQNAIIAGHQVTPLLPNMLFHITRDAQGLIDVVYTYACLKGEQFSFNVLSRRSDRTEGEINQLISDADELTKKVLNVEKMRVSDGETFEGCDKEFGDKPVTS